MIKVKVCGITRREDAELAQQLGAWAIGFVFYPESSAYVTPEKAFEISKGLTIKKVGVFVNESVEKTEEIAKLLGLDIIQYHGSETPKELEKTNHAIIKAVSNLDTAESFKGNSKILGYLADHVSDDKLCGGSGMLADWNFAKELKNRNPDKLLILAGGLNLSNIKDAVNTVHPDVIDISSGLSVDGIRSIKCEVKMRKFFQIIGDINNVITG